MNKDTESKIVDIFKKNLEDNHMDDATLLDAPLSSLSINSITFIKIIVMLEGEFGIEIDPENLDINVFSSIKSFTSHIESKLI